MGPSEMTHHIVPALHTLASKRMLSISQHRNYIIVNGLSSNNAIIYLLDNVSADTCCWVFCWVVLLFAKLCGIEVSPISTCWKHKGVTGSLLWGNVNVSATRSLLFQSSPYLPALTVVQLYLLISPQLHQPAQILFNISFPSDTVFPSR